MTGLRTPRGLSFVTAMLLRDKMPRTLMVGEKVMLLVWVSGIALVLVLALTVLFGALNERRLQKINETYRPAVQLSEHLREVLVAINNELRGAVATRDPALLLSSDSLRSDFLATLESERTSEAFELLEMQAIRRSFDGYFLPARAVSERLILEQTTALDMNELAVMRVRFDSTLRLLESNAVTARHNIDQAFAAAARLQRMSWKGIAFISLLCLVVLVKLSRATVRSLTSSIRQAVHVADRLAQGDLHTTIEVTSDDEVGQLLRAMQGTVAYLDEMATVARAIADGDLSARPRPRSETDAFGTAFVQMTEYLTEVAGVAHRIAEGDLSVRVKLRSPADGFGTALTRMVAQLSETMNGLRGSEQRNRQLAEELYASRERLEYLMSSSPAVIYSRGLGRGTPLTFISGNVQNQLGFTSADLRENPKLWESRLHSDDHSTVLESLSELRITGRSSLEYRMQQPDGTHRWIQDEAKIVQGSNAADREIVGWWVDVSDRRRAEESLQTSEDQLRMAQRLEAVGQLAGGVAHDFNNLLTAILSYSELLLEEIAPGDPNRDDVSEIKKAAQRAAVLTQQLLSFSRKQVRQTRVLDVNSVVAEMEKMLQRLIGENIALTADLGSAIGSVRADSGQLEQILVNLVVNARDAMPDGGMLKITTREVLLGPGNPSLAAGVEPGRYAVLEVSDTGCGMDQDTQSRIFEPFFTTKAVGKGTGLGLATVYGIMKQSGGHITVRSEEGDGTTFTAYFPIVSEATEMVHEDVSIRSVTRHFETVLVVEDEDVLRQLTRKILERSGYTILEARHGGEALTVHEQHPTGIDLVVTDVMMPVMGGRQMADRLRERRPDTKVLFMSGYTDGNISEHGIAEAGTGFLSKPFTPQALAAKVRQVLDGAA